MVRDREISSDENAFVRIVERINEKLEPVFGAPPVTANGPDPGEIALALCPLCHHPMGEHSINHDTPNAVLHCPVPDAERTPSPSRHDPLGELGMPASAKRVERMQQRGEL